MTPTAEIISRLPPRAGERFRHLLGQRDAASAASSDLSARLHDLRGDRAEMNNGLRNMLNPLFTGQATRLSPDDPSVRSMQARIATMDAEIARINELVREQSAAASAAGALILRVSEFVADIRPEVRLSDHQNRVPPVKKGETISDAIESRRHRVAELMAERAAVEAAPTPSAEAKRIAHAQIAELAERGRPNVAALLATGGDSFKFATILGLAKIPQVGVGEVAQTDVEGLVCWLFQPQLIAAVDTLIDQQADDAHALTDRQRAERLEQIARDLLAAEREEVALIDAAREQAQIIPHRDDVDPRALLAIETQLRAQAA